MRTLRTRKVGDKLFIILPVEIDGYDSLVSLNGGESWIRCEYLPACDGSVTAFMVLHETDDGAPFVAIGEDGEEVVPCATCGRIVAGALTDAGECSECASPECRARVAELRAAIARRAVPGEWRYLSEWGAFYGVDSHGELLTLGATSEGHVDLSFPHGPEGGAVEFMCPHFLAAVNALLGTDFSMSKFQFNGDGCPDCEREAE